jgi:hypothetical protein
MNIYKRGCHNVWQPRSIFIDSLSIYTLSASTLFRSSSNIFFIFITKG